MLHRRAKSQVCTTDWSWERGGLRERNRRTESGGGARTPEAEDLCSPWRPSALGMARRVGGFRTAEWEKGCPCLVAGPGPGFRTSTKFIMKPHGGFPGPAHRQRGRALAPAAGQRGPPCEGLVGEGVVSETPPPRSFTGIVARMCIEGVAQSFARKPENLHYPSCWRLI